MARILFFLCSIVLLIGGIYWLTFDNGDVLITALGYEIETSLTLLVLIVLFVTFVISLIFKLILSIVLFPFNLVKMFKKIQDHGYTEKVHDFFTAIYLNNIESMQKISTQLQKSNLPERVKGIIYLLVSKLSGKLEEGELLNLAKNNETKVYALTLLAEYKIGRKDFSAAKNYAEEAWQIEKNYLTAKCLIKIYGLLADWQKLTDFVDSIRIAYLIGNEKKNASLGFARLMLARECFISGDLKSALKNLNEARKLIDIISPLQQLLIQIYLKQNKVKSATNELKLSWSKNPSYSLALIALGLRKKLDNGDFFELAKELLKIAPQNYESHILLANAALDFDQFDMAAKEIGEALSDGHKVRACHLMAEFCIRTHGNNTEALSWLHYAKQAENDMLEPSYLFDLNELKILQKQDHVVPNLDDYVAMSKVL